MRRDALYIQDMVDAVDAIASFLGGKDCDALRTSDLLQSAVLQKLTVIGEAASRVSPGVEGPIPECRVAPNCPLPKHHHPPTLRKELAPVLAALRNDDV